MAALDPKTDPNSTLGRVGAQWAGEALQLEFQREVAQLLGRSSIKFPGAQPVSFAARHLNELKQQDYWVCEKTDGERFLLWMTQDGPKPVVYFVNRRNEYYYVPDFYFPHHERKNDFHRDTILDGELVEDKHPDGHTETNFLVFDMLIVDGKSMIDRSLDKRMGYFKEWVLKPYQQKGGVGPFRVKDKAIEFAYGLDKMFLEIIPKVKQLHGNDGLIFTCRDHKYQSGTDPNILKWKPPEENTVDFLMHIVWSSVEPDPSDPIGSLIEDYDAFPAGFELWVHHATERGEALYQKHGDLYVTESEWEEWKRRGRPVQDIIAECFQEQITANGDGHHVNGNGTGGTRWRWFRFRDDKDESNHITTYNSVIQSIMDRVTQGDLLKEQAEIRDCWKKRNQPSR